MQRGDGERLLEIALHIDERARPVHKHRVLEVEEEGAVIAVDRADRTHLVVRKESLGVNEPGRVLVDFHARANEREIVGAREREHDALIGNIRRDDAHVHPARRRHDERLAQAVIDDEIGRHDPHIVLGGVENVDIHVLADAARIHGARSAAVGLDKPLALELFVHGRNIGRKIFVRPDADVIQFQKHQQKPLDALPFQPHRRIFPISEGMLDVDVLVGEIDAARVADAPVDHGDLAVVAVVMHVGHDGYEGIELDALNAELLHLFVIDKVDFAHAPDVVVHKTHFDALFHLAGEDFEDAVPELPARDDEIFHENIFLGAFQIFQKARPEQFARGEILRFGVLVHAGGRLVRKERLAHVRPAAHILVQPPQRDAAVIVFFGVLVQQAIALLHLARGAVRGEHAVDRHAEDIEKDDAQNPRDLSLGNHVAVGGVKRGEKDDQPAEHLQRNRDPRSRLRELHGKPAREQVDDPADHENVYDKEQDDRERDDGKPAEYTF